MGAAENYILTRRARKDSVVAARKSSSRIFAELFTVHDPAHGASEESSQIGLGRVGNLTDRTPSGQEVLKYLTGRGEATLIRSDSREVI